MSIVTKTGDRGTTSLMYGRRVSKCDPRVEAYGEVDELNAALGLARATAQDDWARECLLAIQRDLVLLMGELATHSDDLQRYTAGGHLLVTASLTAKLDEAVKKLEADLQAFEGWATPGSTLHSAALDLARTVCRRAERRVCRLQDSGAVTNSEMIVFLNRLSDLLWLMARRAEQDPQEGRAS